MNVHMPFPAPAPKVCCCLPNHMTQKILKKEGPAPVLQFQQILVLWSGPLGFSQQAIGQVITTNEPWLAHHRIKESTNQCICLFIETSLVLSVHVYFYWFFSSWSPRCVWKYLPRQWKPKSERLSKVLVMILWWLSDRCFRRLGLVAKNDVGVSKTSMQHKFGQQMTLSSSEIPCSRETMDEASTFDPFGLHEALFARKETRDLGWNLFESLVKALCR